MQAWPVDTQLPALTDFQGEAELPSTPCQGLYLLIDKDDKIVYVGQSCDIRTRLRTHRREASKEFRVARWFRVRDASERLALEGVLILLLRPRYNRALILGLSESRVWEIKFPAAFARGPRPARKRPRRQKARQ